jgi:hypothetical protein
MISKGLLLLSCGLIVLTLAAAAVVGTGAGTNGNRLAQGREFQQLVGGLGSGPAVDLTICPFCFDARLSRGCQWDQEPIPGGVYFCPEHGCSIFYYSPNPETQENKESGHAVFP